MCVARHGAVAASWTNVASEVQPLVPDSAALVEPRKLQDRLRRMLGLFYTDNMSPIENHTSPALNERRRRLIAQIGELESARKRHRARFRGAGENAVAHIPLPGIVPVLLPTALMLHDQDDGHAGGPLLAPPPLSASQLAHHHLHPQSGLITGAGGDELAALSLSSYDAAALAGMSSGASSVSDSAADSAADSSTVAAAAAAAAAAGSAAVPPTVAAAGTPGAALSLAIAASQLGLSFAPAALSTSAGAEALFRAVSAQVERAERELQARMRVLAAARAHAVATLAREEE